jgi:septum formation protein
MPFFVFKRYRCIKKRYLLKIIQKNDYLVLFSEGNMYKIILASGSPRRKELLEQIGVKFVVISSDKEELTCKIKPEEIVADLALLKASDVALGIPEKAIIIGADTMVAVNGEVLGKPRNKDEAKEMLFKIQGTKHQVYTGVAVFSTGESPKNNDKVLLLQFAEESNVWVHPMTEEQIEDYISTGEPFDKAGGYGIQGKFAVHIEKIEGDYNNIVGFPIGRLYQELLEIGIDITKFH